MSNTVRYILLGGGYSLNRLAENLPKQELVITTTSVEKKSSFIQQGFNSELVDVANTSELESLFNKYPSADTLIDSVPASEISTQYAENITKLKNRNLSRLIYLSTTGVFGVEDGSWVDEQTLSLPNNEKSAARLKVENIYKNSELQTIILRLSAIYGPGRGIGIALKNKRYRMLETSERWSNRIHVDDIVNTLKKILSTPIGSSLPGLMCLTDSKPSMLNEVVNYYCQKFSFEKPVSISMKDVADSAAHTLRSNQRVSNKLLLNFLDQNLKYPSYVEGSDAEHL